MKSLIVEDNFTSRIILMEILGDYGDVHVAVDGEEAVEALKENVYDLVCLDISMPKMSGHEVLQHLRDTEQGRGVELGHGAKVIMTTGKSDSSNVMTAFRHNCDSYMVKPINIADFVNTLKELHLV